MISKKKNLGFKFFYKGQRAVWHSKVENDWYQNYTKRYNSSMISLNSDDSVVNVEPQFEAGDDVKLREDFLNNNSQFFRRLRDIVKRVKDVDVMEKTMDKKKN